MPTTLNPLYYFRRVYDWTMRWAEHPKGTYALALLSAIEGIFCPIPIDPFLLAMCAARPKKSLFYSGVASIFSVLGGSIGYFLGLWAWSLFSPFFFQYLFSPSAFDQVISMFNNNAFLAIFLASFTPIPYKVFAVAGGVAQIDFWTFLLASLIGRSMRFFTMGIMLYFWGPPIRNFIERNFEKLTVALCGLLVAVYIIYRFV